MTDETNRPSSDSAATESDALRTVRAMYAAFGRSDEDGLRRVIAADVEWIQCPGFPGGEHRRGIDSVIAGVLHGNKSLWTGFRVDLDEFLDAGDRVVVIGSYSGAHHATGKEMHSVFTHVYDCRDGRIVRFRQFADTWPMVQAMQA